MADVEYSKERVLLMQSWEDIFYRMCLPEISEVSLLEKHYLWTNLEFFYNYVTYIIWDDYAISACRYA
jgi:hypothetical protein